MERTIRCFGKTRPGASRSGIITELQLVEAFLLEKLTKALLVRFEVMGPKADCEKKRTIGTANSRLGILVAHPRAQNQTILNFDLNEGDWLLSEGLAPQFIVHPCPLDPDDCSSVGLYGRSKPPNGCSGGYDNDSIHFTPAPLTLGARD